jgi:predicted N-acetyltransferase YhbS
MKTYSIRPEREEEFPLHEPAEIPGQYALACELYDGALAGKAGVFNFFK